jgi:hypothetical protein
MDATTTYQLTYDTDNNRINSSPSVIVLPSGQRIAFYSKFLTTGKISFSRITFVAPSFDISVEAGNGELNGISGITWSSGNLIATPNSFQLVYVTTAGVLGIGTNLTMSFLKDVILLAYVSSGNSSITRIQELEHSGNYIYVRKQTLLGSTWTWNDYEELLNTGSNPMCFYNSNTGYIYLNYTKDSATYVREFNPADELTWETLQSITITSGTITLNRDPENTLAVAGCSSGYKSGVVIESNEYPIGVPGFAFVNDQPYVFLPSVGGDYLSYIKSGITYEFFTLVGNDYILEATYTLSKYQATGYQNRYKLWTGTIGVKYVGIRLNTILFTDEFVTSPNYYVFFELYPYPDKTVLIDPDNYTVDTKDNMLFSALSSGYKSLVTTTAEYIETKDFEFDSGDVAISSGYKSPVTTTAEYIETKDFETDTGDVAVSSGYKTEITIISTPF